ncbi:MAG: Ig-like domain-containing protein, partial [Bacteroidota bacterium]
MMRATPIPLKLLASTLYILLCSQTVFGIHHFVPTPVTTNEVAGTVNYLHFANDVAEVLMMEDTACTSTTTDTFFVNTLPNTDSYNWTIPTGAVITATLGDTMIVVDWTNSTTGLLDICIETVNNCGSSTPVCFPIRVIVCNTAPMAVDDRDTTLSNQPITIAVQNNDTDPENDNLTTSLLASSLPTNGTRTLSGNQIQYTPNANFIGTDSFDYVVCDSGTPSLCDTATVTVVVLNRPPVALDDTNSTDEDIPFNGSVLPNDNDPENGSLTVNTTPIDQPDNGSVTLNTNGTYIYTPNAEFSGTDSFQYEVCDNEVPSLCDTATVTITINPVNDNPVAVEDTNSTDEDTPVNGSVLPNDSDPENDNLTINTTPIDQPDNGSVSLNANGTYTYIPAPDFNGTDSFQYEVCDDGTPSLCDTATVTITVNPVNDNPIAVDDTNSTDEDTPVNGNVLPNDSDPENDNLTVNTTPIDQPDNGTLTLNPNGTYTYTPNPGFNGNDSFQYEVCDDGTPSQCDTATVNISVGAVNDKPVAVDDTNTTDEDT